LLISFAVLAVLCATPATAHAQADSLCILDFNRLGDDSSMDWLTPGLADMMITTMNRMSPYRVLNREHLREILQEHRLRSSGLTNLESALQQAQIVKAELLLMGSFAVKKERLIVQVRLLQISDQKVVAIASWEGDALKVMDAPEELSRKLLADIRNPFEETLLSGIEKDIPRTIDVAKAFYKGVAAFDNGKYPQALAYYLDGVERTGTFIRIYRSALQMYYLLGQKEQAVAFAADKAHKFADTDDRAFAAELYFTAAEKAIELLSNQKLAEQYLEQLISLALKHEQQTHQAQQTKDAFKKDILGLYQQHGGPLPPREYGRITRRWKPYLWLQKLRNQLRWFAETQAEGGYFVEEGGTWVKKPLLDPSVLMWKIRTHYYLAQIFHEAKKYQPALTNYKAILKEYEFIEELPIYKGSEKFDWRDDIQDQARRSLWELHKESGVLFRDDYLFEKLKIQTVSDQKKFEREFKTLARHPQAYSWANKNNWGYEDFNFAAPEGYQIERVDLKARVKGLAFFNIGIPHTRGKRESMFSGRHKTTVKLRKGTRAVKINTQWGCGWSGQPFECLVGWFTRPADNKQILRWEATFHLSPEEPASPLTPRKNKDFREASRKIIEHETKKDSWDGGIVIRAADTKMYTGKPPLDVYAKDWLVATLNGDIHIFNQHNPKMTIGIPQSINTDNIEFDASLIRTHQGGLALLWTRGQGGKLREYFIALTTDLINWDFPQTLKFDKPAKVSGYHGSNPDRTFNIVDVPGAYLMLLEDGFVRYSKDLRHWEAPKRLFRQTGSRNTVLKTKDGRIWVICAHYSPQEVSSRSDVDSMSGYSVVNGRIMMHREAITVTTSTDGVHWSPAQRIELGRETSGLWAFPISETQIGIVTQYNNRDLKWFYSSASLLFRSIKSPVTLLLAHKQIHFFINNRQISAAQALPDRHAEHRDVLFIRTSSEVSRRLLQ